MQRDAKSFTAKFCRARAFDGVEQFDLAAPIYQRLLEQMHDDDIAQSERYDLLISAGRNFANRNEIAKAIELFAKIDKETFEKQHELRREFAGLMSHHGEPGKAVTFLLQHSFDNRADRLLLANMLSADKQFTSAMSECRILLKSDPNDVDGLRLMAQCAMATQDFPFAANSLEKVLDTLPGDVETLRTLAFAFLWDKHGEQALEVLDQLNEIDSQNDDLQESFVEATLYVDHLSRQHLDHLNQIAVRQCAGEYDIVVTELLVSSMIKHRQTTTLVPLLTSLVEHSPERLELRLQLVDLLESRGEFELAEPHLRKLMSETSQPGLAKPMALGFDSKAKVNPQAFAKSPRSSRLNAMARPTSR